MPEPQILVAGRYRLLRQLGSGGMGRVWLADDEMLGRHVAIKEVVIPAGLGPDDHAEMRFRTLREARTAARLNHPHVVKIYDVVNTEEQPWIVMEYVPSRSLHEVISDEGALEPARVARIGLALLDALIAAHRAGVLHRDVKPGNVLLGPYGRVVLTDFGLATFDGVDVSVTSPGLVLGSVRFVAPERARDNTATPETDLWALGATLYAAVEGQPPYARYNAMETLAALARTLPDPPRRAGRLQPVLAGLLRRDPRDRLRPEELRPLLERAAAEGDSGTGATRSRQRRERLTVSVLAAAVVLVAAAGTLFAAADTGRRPGPPATAGSTRASPGSVPVPDAVLAAACPAGDPVVVRPATRQPNWPALPTGWSWYRDRTGFRVAMPEGWSAYLGPAGVCFREAGDTRWLAITSWTGADDPLGHVTARERTLVSPSAPAGYERIGMAPVPYYRGGADWEYRFLDRAGARMHAVTRDFITSADAGYTVVWCTRDFDWQLNLDNFRLVTASFAPPP
jgi:eukaryotic-like serine/threonine-protein kinase